MPKPRPGRMPAAIQPFTLEATLGHVAAAQRRYRAGKGSGHTGRGGGSLPVEIRNGLPELVRYVYGGSGEDIYLGSYGDPRLDEPDA